MLNVDFTKLTQLDQEFDGTNNIDNKLSPVVGVGFYYYSKRFYAGISVPNLLETRHFDYSSGSASTVSYIGNEQMNFYLIAGHVFDIDENWEFKPAVLTKLVFGTPLQLDISANFWYKKMLTLGDAYRWDAAYRLMSGFNVSKSIMIGLAYDKEVTELGNTLYNVGSFEIVIRAELFKRFYKDCTCLRFF
jgi:type IX secretion system PorP/SprF family membrane protein